MKIDLTALSELETDLDSPVISCRWLNSYFSTEFVKSLRKEILQKVFLVNTGLDDFSKADVLAIHFLNDLCEYQLNKKLIVDDVQI